MNRFCLFALLLVFGNCRPPKPPESPDAWKKIKLDFRRLDADGLAGPAGGKVSLNYEFCIPAESKAWNAVHKIDPTASKTKGKGRVGCKENQWLIIGSTQQKNYQRVLYELATLPFVERIEEVFWE